MPVETVFNTAPVKEPPVARRRSIENAASSGGEGFSLPETKGKGAGAPEPDKAAASDGKPDAGNGQEAAAAAAAKAVAKTADPAKPAGEPAVRSEPGSRQAQPDAFIGTLTELLAAAQGRAVPSEEGDSTKAVATDQPGEKDAAGKTSGDATGKTEKKKAKGADAASSDKTSDKPAGDAIVVAPSPEQKPAPQPVAAIVTLALPVAGTEGGEATKEASEAKGGAVSGEARVLAKAQAQAVAVPVGPAAGSVGADASAAGPASGGARAVAAAVPGASSTSAEDARKVRDAEAAADAKGLAKADAAQPATPVQTGPAAASETKPIDAVQQALAPLDLGALVQQAAGKGEPMRLLSPLDQAAVPNPALPPGQAAAAALPGTPLHVVPIEIGLRALSGAKQFDIRLDPDELGRVDVNLSISDKGEVSARLVVDRVETLHLLQRDARTLERAFEQAGLKPSDGGVDISLRDNSDQSAFRQHRQQEEAPQRPRQPSFAETGDDSVLPVTPVPQRRLVRLGGVDLSI